MYLFFVVIQLIICVALVGVILLQRSSSDGLSGLGGGSSGNQFLSGRASANLLTRTTAILAALFMINSLVLATMANRSSNQKSLLDKVVEDPATPGKKSAPAEKNAQPSSPSVPVAQ